MKSRMERMASALGWPTEVLNQATALAITALCLAFLSANEAAGASPPAKDQLTTGLVAYYPLNGNARDASGNAHNAAVKGRGLRLTADRAGHPNAAWHFDFNSWILAPKSASLEPSAALTVSVWVKPDRLVAPGSQTVILTKRYDIYNAPWNSYILVLGDGREGPGVAGGQPGQAMFGLSTLGAQTCIEGGAPLSTKDWSHVVGTYDGAKLTLFVNGQQVASGPKSGPIDYGPLGLMIGATTDPGERFLGNISEIRIYDRALSTADIQKLYALKPPPPPATEQPAAAPGSTSAQEFLAQALKLQQEGKPAADTSLAGTYALVSVDGKKVPGTLEHEGHSVAVKSGAFIINSDGTCSSKVVFGVPPGSDFTREVKATYTRQGSTLTMQWEGAGMTTGTVAGDTFTMNNEGMLFVYRKAPGSK